MNPITGGFATVGRMDRAGPLTCSCSALVRVGSRPHVVLDVWPSGDEGGTFALSRGFSYRPESGTSTVSPGLIRHAGPAGPQIPNRSDA